MNNNYKSVIYFLDNELIPEREELNKMRGVGTNIVLPSAKLDANGYPASFSAVSLNQYNVPTTIYTTDNHYEELEMESDKSINGYNIKVSTVSMIVNNLYKRGISSKIVHKYKKHEEDTEYIQEIYDISVGSPLSTQLKEFYNVVSKQEYIATQINKGKVEISKNKFWRYTKMSVESVFGSVENFEKQLRIFKRYSEVYGFDKYNPIDLLEFYYIQQHREIAEVYIDNKFICPHCRSTVRVNNGGGVYNINNGLYYNQGITICEHCYTEFDIHDKQDILDLAHNTAK